MIATVAITWVLLNLLMGALVLVDLVERESPGPVRVLLMLVGVGGLWRIASPDRALAYWVKLPMTAKARRRAAEHARARIVAGRIGGWR